MNRQDLAYTSPPERPPRLTRRAALLRIAGTGGGLALVAGLDTQTGASLLTARAQEGTPMTDTTTATGSIPTIVLVHGAFAESASWNGVVPALLTGGFPVVAAANPLRGVASDAAYVAGVLAGLPGPIVLVGHSYGGIVISGAAGGNDNVKALVYVAGFAPDAGESAGDLAGRFPGGTLGETLVPIALPSGGNDLYILQEKFRAQFAADVPAAEAALMGATQRPVTEAGLNDKFDPAGTPAWKTIPSWFVYGELDKNIPAAAHAFMAERAGAKGTVEVPGASHVVMVSQAQAVAEVILAAASAVG